MQKNIVLLSRLSQLAHGGFSEFANSTRCRMSWSVGGCCMPSFSWVTCLYTNGIYTAVKLIFPFPRSRGCVFMYIVTRKSDKTPSRRCRVRAGSARRRCESRRRGKAHNSSRGRRRRWEGSWDRRRAARVRRPRPRSRWWSHRIPRSRSSPSPALFPPSSSFNKHGPA